MHCALLQVSLQVPDLKRALHGYLGLGALLDGTQGRRVLDFASMGDVEVVESRLKEVINRWLETESSWEVEYSLRSGVKGKSRA